MQMDKEKALRQQQPQQQQPQLPVATAPDLWPHPISGEHERLESDCKREGMGSGWSFSVFGGLGHETPGRRLTRPRRTRVREKR